MKDGRAVLAGSYTDDGFSEVAIARINPDGSAAALIFLWGGSRL